MKTDKSTPVTSVNVNIDKQLNISVHVDPNYLENGKLIGYVRFRNTHWINKAQAFAPLKIFAASNLTLNLSKSKIFLNNNLTTEREEIFITFNGTIKPDMTKVSLDCTRLPTGIKAVLSPASGSIVLTGAKNVSVGLYPLKVKYSDDNPRVRLSSTLQISVKNTKPDKGMELELKGGTIDPLCQTKIYIKPTIYGYAGDIVSVAMKKNHKCEDDALYLPRGVGRRVHHRVPPRSVRLPGGWL